MRRMKKIRLAEIPTGTSMLDLKEQAAYASRMAEDYEERKKHRLASVWRSTAMRLRQEMLKQSGAKLAGSSKFGASADEYGMSHRPPKDGPPLHDLMEGGLAPRDIYEAPASWYTGFPEIVSETSSQIRRCRGNPSCRVSIFRAGPTMELNPGDWVSLSREYAIQHRDSIDPQTYQSCKFRADAKYIRWAGDDLMEWGYFGPPVKALGAGFCSRNRKEWIPEKKRKKSLGRLEREGRIPAAQVKRAMKALGRKVQKCGITAAALREGMEVEREHSDVTGLGLKKTAKVAAAHLCERPDYYKRLKRFVER